MKFINASQVREITENAIEHGFDCEETYELGNTDVPVILSELTDEYGEVANKLVAKGIPVLYFSYEPKEELSRRVYEISGGEMNWSDIESWLQSVKNTIPQTGIETRNSPVVVSVSEKKTISVFSIRPGVGGRTIARNIAIASAKKRKTVWIDLNYRFPEIPYLLNYKNRQYSLNSLIENLGKNEKVNVMDYCINKEKLSSILPFQKKIPDDLYVIACDGEIGAEFFPQLQKTFEEATDIMKNLVQNLERHFDAVIFSMSSDYDELLNLAVLNVTDPIFVTDAHPASVFLYKSRKELLANAGIKVANSMTVISKMPLNVKTQGIEDEIGEKAHFVIPYDNKLMERVTDLQMTGTAKFQNAIEDMEFELFSTEEEKQERKAKKEKRLWGR